MDIESSGKITPFVSVNTIKEHLVWEAGNMSISFQLDIATFGKLLAVFPFPTFGVVPCAVIRARRLTRFSSIP